MVITCQRCSTSFVLQDDLVSSSGTAVQCSRCQHTFLVTPTGGPPADRLINCPRCATSFQIAGALIAREGALAQCSQCGFVFGASGRPPVPAPAPPPRPQMFVFGQQSQSVNELPDPEQPAAESYRGGVGRVMFGMERGLRDDRVMIFGGPPPAPRPPAPASANAMVFGAAPEEAYRSAEGRAVLLAPEPPPQPPRERSKPVAPTTPVDELDRMLAHSADHLDDEQSLLVLSDALMERGDPRGRLIGFMLEEERQTNLMRKVKVNVLIRDHAAQWAPPGARITGFHRGLPADLEWNAPSDPHHLAWRSARSIHVTLERVPPHSVFDVLRPNLRRVTGLNRAFFTHVAAIAPAGLETIDGQLHPDDLLTSAEQILARMPKLKSATLRTTLQHLDPRISEEHLASVLEGGARLGLQGLRLSMPQLPLSVLDRCLARAPRLNVLFVVPWIDGQQQVVELSVDARRRVVLVPRWADAVLREFVEGLSQFLGERLSIVQATSDR